MSLAPYAPRFFPVVMPPSLAGTWRPFRGADGTPKLLTRPGLSDQYAAMRGAFQHKALDIIAPEGAPIVADDELEVLRTWVNVDATTGKRTTLAGTGVGARSGNFIRARGVRDGLVRQFSHLRDPALVSPGERVEAGRLMGYVGNTGRAGPMHLHFGMPAHNPYPELRALYDRGLWKLELHADVRGWQLAALATVTLACLGGVWLLT